MTSPVTAFGINNVIVPRGGPKCVPVNLDFSSAGQVDIDGQQIIDAGQIEFLQGVFIDNGSNAAPFTLVMGTTGQRIIAAPNTQGYYSILAVNPPKFTATTTPGVIIPAIFYNVPVQAAVWKTT